MPISSIAAQAECRSLTQITGLLLGLAALMLSVTLDRDPALALLTAG